MDIPVHSSSPRLRSSWPWPARCFGRSVLRAGWRSGADRQHGPDGRLQLLFALVLGSTLFGSLWAIADQGDVLAASLVTVGVATSFLPVLIRVLPPLARDARTSERDPNFAVSVVGLFVYVVLVGAAVALINID